MKNKLFLIFLLSFFGSSYSQEKENIQADKKSFIQFETSIPFTANRDFAKDEDDADIVFNGLNARIGYGRHMTNWFAISAHSGVEWRIIEKLVAAPIYANLTISPKVGDETRINLQLGYGYSFALGRGNLSGLYKRLSLGLETEEGIIFFAELSEHGYTLNGIDKIGSLSIGIALRSY